MSTPEVEHKELTPEEKLKARCHDLIYLMTERLLIPFLGAGVNLTNCHEKPPGEEDVFDPDGPYLPSGKQLSKSIAGACKYPWRDESLLRVSWYASYAKNEDGVVYGRDRLYKHLHRIFARDRKYDVTDLHKFFASLPKRLEAKGYPNRHQIIVTTNYDEQLERAFDDENQSYDIISYVERRGFRLTPHNGQPRFLSNDDYVTAPLDRTLILKIHGAVDRKYWQRSSFVITEDDYIDYVAFRIPDRIPATLLDEIQSRRFLFLGYSLSDWNLRVLLRGIKAHSPFQEDTLAVMNNYEEWDPMYWKRHGVLLEKWSLKDYMATLNEQLNAFPDGPGE